ncbi:hypothetical protein G4G27_10080 [Sphingomonas sp. So64.6b]|uniref:hypothetical protein n=1 Tax=Sphingomonas sp. So64.6b TaxID=2997354 RepID=UPI0016026714|nr:hypothetical protein [Sphingomonas sp. So64.6b]QNA84297.1 hypothetical protein G4G27_10080 [Sphingomonas sp. So64.6b]
MNEREIAAVIGQWLGILCLPLVLGFLGYVLSKKMSATRDENVRWPTHVGIVLGLLAAVSALGQRASISPEAVATEADEKHVVAVTDGMADAPFPAEIDPVTLEGARERLAQEISNRYGDRLRLLSSEITAQKLGNKTILRFNARASGGTLIVQYIGVLNGKRKLVTCVAMDGADFPACRQRAIDIFGTPPAGNSKNADNG